MIKSITHKISLQHSITYLKERSKVCHRRFIHCDDMQRTNPERFNYWAKKKRHWSLARDELDMKINHFEYELKKEKTGLIIL